MRLLAKDCDRKRNVEDISSFEDIVSESGDYMFENLFLLVNNSFISWNEAVFLSLPLGEKVVAFHYIFINVISFDRREDVAMMQIGLLKFLRKLLRVFWYFERI